MVHRRLKMPSSVCLLMCTLGWRPRESSDSSVGKNKQTRSVSKRWANRSILGLRLNSKCVCLTGREWCKVLWRDLEHGHLCFHYLTYTDMKMFFLLFVSISLFLGFFLLFFSFKDILLRARFLTTPVGLYSKCTRKLVLGCCFPVTACLEALVSVMLCGVT